MKTTLTHLGERKRMELETIVRMIRKAINVEMIILFGSYARGNAVEELGKKAAGQEPEFLKVFPKGTAEEKRLFELLKRAYVDARYDKNYTITREELQWLARRVQILQDLTEKKCIKKIANFVS